VYVFSRKQQDGSVPIFFQGLGENTCLFQLALKSNAPGLSCFFLSEADKSEFLFENHYFSDVTSQ